MWPFNSNVKKPSNNAGNLPNMLMNVAIEMTPFFTSALLLEEISDKENAVMHREVLAFTLHLTDRILFTALGPKDRGLLMDNLIVDTDVLLYTSNLPRIMDYYEERSLFYSKFSKIFEGEDGKKDGTLFYEFGKSFVSLHGDTSSKLVPMMTLQLATYAMQLWGFINDVLIKERIIRN